MKKYLMLIGVIILLHSNASAGEVTVESSDGCASAALTGPDSDTGEPYSIRATGKNKLGSGYTATLKIDEKPPLISSTPRGDEFYKSYGPFEGKHTFILDFEASGCTRTATLVVEKMEPKQMAEGICSSINALPGTAFKSTPNQRKQAFCAKTDEVVSLISAAETSTSSTDKSQYYQTAIDKLQNDIAAKMDSQAGGQPNNDWITDKESQESIYNDVKDLIDVLKALK